jgi:hypothetical protein
MANTMTARSRSARDAAAKDEEDEKDAHRAGIRAILQPCCELAAPRTNRDIAKREAIDVRFKHER